MTILSLLRSPAAAAGSRDTGKGLLGRISQCGGTIAGWIARRRTRIALSDIAHDDHLLKDIGVSREEALREADKPFWRP